MTTFEGIWAALITPFDSKNTLNQSALRDLVDYLLSCGVDGLYLCGSTGEGLYMSVEERKQVTAIVIEQVNGRIPIITHVGAVALVDAITLAQHAQNCGANGVSSIIPPKFADLESTVAYYAGLAQAIPDFPIISYLMNPAVDALVLTEKLLPYTNIVGVKYTGANMNEFRQIVQLNDGRDWTVFSGMDEQSLYGLMMGSSGHIGSTINLMPHGYQIIRNHYLAGEYQQAQVMQERVNHVTNTLYSTGNFFGALKYAMNKRGVDVGSPRLPGLPLTAEQCAFVDNHVTNDMLADL